MKKFLFVPVIAALLFVGAGCEDLQIASYTSDSQNVESIQKRLIDSTPIPKLTQSQERQNIVARAKTFDVQNKVGYLYLVNYGKVMAFYTIKGKVSSLNSYVTPLDKLVDYKGRPCGELSSDCFTVSAPDIDGAYGENARGIFFFTTEGAYVEWMGDYLYADQPLKLTTQPELVRQIQ